MRPLEPSRTIHVLCVDDDPDDLALIALALERNDPARTYSLRRVESATAFMQALAEPTDIVLCDFHMPRFSPQAALQLLERLQSPVPLVVVTRSMGEEAAVAVLRAGAKDYVTKDRLESLPQVIARVMADHRRRQEQQRSHSDLVDANERLRTLSARLVRSHEREREALSRELHDQVAQSIAAVGIHLKAADEATLPEVNVHHRRVARELASSTLEQLRNLAFTLRPAQLDYLGLSAALPMLVERLADPAGLACEVSVRGDEPMPPGDSASVVLRVAADAMACLLRNTSVTLVQMRLRFLRDGRIALLVVDNGTPADPPADAGNATPEKDASLGGVIELAELAGGSARLYFHPRRGTAIRAII